MPSLESLPLFGGALPSASIAPLPEQARLLGPMACGCCRGTGYVNYKVWTDNDTRHGRIERHSRYCTCEAGLRLRENESMQEA